MSDRRIPLHLQISQVLRQRIETGVYAVGEQLPSEHQLMEQFQVSRITIRRAIHNLVHQGLASAQHGRGVFVKNQCKWVYSLSSPLIFFEEDMKRQGVQSAICHLEFQEVSPPPRVQEILGSDLACFQSKILLLDGIPAILDKSYILLELGRQFANELKTAMTFPTLERNGIHISKIETSLECTRADQQLSEHLAVPLGEPLLVYCYTAYDQYQRSLVYGSAPSRADLLTYAVTINR
jgi:GntR family transcriptional regulator